MEDIKAKWKEFHQKNPEVYRRLVDLARRLKGNGHSRYSIKGLFEYLRADAALSTRGDFFKLNNNYTALYARLISEREPDLDGFFETRSRPAEGREYDERPQYTLFPQ